MKRKVARTIALPSFALFAVLCAAWQAQAEDSKTTYVRIAPLKQYLIADRDAEIAMARSAAPESISHDAEVLVLGRHGYETAVKGKNGFVCVVERSWTSPYDDPEFLNPALRAPLCLNPAAIKSAYDKKELPTPEPGAMCYMMSKQQYFGAKDGKADPHLMFWFPKTDDMAWGAGLPGSPVYVHQDSPDPITTFIISVSKWSDGTDAPGDEH
jgi:hypothetical protein